MWWGLVVAFTSSTLEGTMVWDASLLLVLIPPGMYEMCEATAWLRFDEKGIAWRTLFRRREIPWTDVTAIEAGTAAVGVGGLAAAALVTTGGDEYVLRPLVLVRRSERKRFWLELQRATAGLPIDLVPSESRLAKDLRAEG